MGVGQRSLFESGNKLRLFCTSKAVRAAKTCLVLVSALTFGQAAAVAGQCDTLRANGAFDWYPVIMRPKDDGMAYGMLPITIAEIAGRLGVSIQYQPITPFKRQLIQLQNGTLDVVLGAYWTKERATKFVYSSSVLDDEVAIFVRKDAEFPLSSWTDLKGRLGIRPFGGSYGEEFDTYSERELTLKTVAPIPGEFRSNMISMLLNRNADYAVLGRFHGLKMIEESRVSNEITDLSWPIVSNGVHVLFSKTSPCADLYERFNRELAVLRDEGWIEDTLAQFKKPKG